MYVYVCMYMYTLHDPTVGHELLNQDGCSTTMLVCARYIISLLGVWLKGCGRWVFQTTYCSNISMPPLKTLSLSKCAFNFSCIQNIIHSLCTQLRPMVAGIQQHQDRCTFPSPVSACIPKTPLIPETPPIPEAPPPPLGSLGTGLRTLCMLRCVCPL